MPRRIVELNGNDWRLGQAPANAAPERAAWQEMEGVVEWLPAQVPGNVRADLVRAGRLPELAYATGPEAAQWVDNHCWWLVRDFPHPASAGGRVHLVLRGVDYIGGPVSQWALSGSPRRDVLAPSSGRHYAAWQPEPAGCSAAGLQVAAVRPEQPLGEALESDRGHTGKHAGPLPPPARHAKVPDEFWLGFRPAPADHGYLGRCVPDRQPRGLYRGHCH